jgi:hypothetical protein
MTASTPVLGYFSPYGLEHASGADRALLETIIYYGSPQLGCRGSSCADMAGARNLTLIPTGGQPIRAHDLGGGYVVFDVPVSFRSGTVTVAGSMKTMNGWTVTMIHPYRVNVSFPG